LLSDQDGYDAIRKVARVAHGLFWRPVSFERYLMRKELQPLSRTDWLPGANELAAQRVRAEPLNATTALPTKVTFGLM